MTKTTVVLLVCVFLSAFFCYALYVMRPAFAALAENRAKEIAISTINQTISQTFASYEMEYGDIVAFERDNDNKINVVKSNLAGISKLKSDLNLEIQKKIAETEQSALKIPLGSLTGNELLIGTGPSVSFRIKPYGNTVTDITTDFSEAGINQTKLDVTVKVTADLSVLMPTMQRKSTVETSVPIIQTVIVGTTPDSYTHVDRDGFSYEDDVLELAE